MTVQQLDFAFPFIVFGYGAIMVFVLGNSRLMTLAEERLNHKQVTALKGKRLVSYICLVLGALWSLQNIWFC